MRTLYTRAVDIRSVADATFTPAETGLTAVTGSNGSGKTTLTTAVPLLAGWGQTPPGTGNLAAIIRDGASTGTVEWAFEIDETTYVVTRSFRRTKAGAATAKATLTINGSDAKTTGLKPGDITAEITRITGMRPDTFLSTSLIAQSDVDALMSATPREVRDRVRDILGLRKIASAAEAMANEIRSVELPDAPDSATVDSLKARAGDAESRAHTAREEFEAARVAEKTARTAHDKAVERGQEIAEKLAAAESSQREHETFTVRAADARRDLDEAQKAYDTALEKTGSGWSGPADQAIELADDRLSTLRYQVQRHGELSGIAAQSTEEVVDAKKAVTAAEKALASAQKKAEKTSAPLDALDADVARAESLVSVLTSTRDTLSNSGCCPTCGTDVGDGENLSARLDQQIDAATGERDRALAAASAAREAHQDATRSAADAARTLTAAEHELRDAETASARVLDARAELDSLGDVSGASEQIDVMKQVGHTAREVVRLTALRDHCGRALSGITLIAAPDQGDVDSARQDYDSTLDTLQEARNTVAAAGARSTELDTLADDARAEYDGAHRRFVTRQDAEKEIAEKQAASALLKRFTTAYTAEKVGVITDAVNRLLPLTSGEFTDFRLDEDFAPTVNYAGATRSTSDLSGGERAVLGLLFRIGVTAAMSGGALVGTIIADEPLAALDSEARQRVTSLLSSLPVPVVLVSHTPEAAETAAVTAHVHRSRFGTTEVDMAVSP